MQAFAKAMVISIANALSSCDPPRCMIRLRGMERDMRDILVSAAESVLSELCTGGAPAELSSARHDVVDRRRALGCHGSVLVPGRATCPCSVTQMHTRAEHVLAVAVAGMRCALSICVQCMPPAPNKDVWGRVQRTARSTGR